MPLDLSASYDLIRYIAGVAADRDVALGRTRLVKLLYLMDVWHLREYGERLTPFDWVFFHYGPYFFDLPQVLDRLHLHLPQEGLNLPSGRRFESIRHGDQMDIEPDRRFGQRGERTVTKVLDEWLAEDLNALLNYVYFHTEPMLTATRRRAPLDLSTVQRRWPASMMASHKDISEEAKLAIQQIKSKAAQRPPSESLNPRPRFDDVYLDALASIEPAPAPVETEVEPDDQIDFGEPRHRT